MIRLLLVDDEAFITDSLARMLQREMGQEIDVYKAYSAQEAVGFLNRVSADIVVTDVQMPGMSGLDLLKEIRQRWPSCQVIFLSAWDDFEYAHDAMKYHAVRYVLKNEGDNVLLEAIRETVGMVEQEAKNSRLLALAQEQLLKYRPLQRQGFLQSFLENSFSAFGQKRIERELERLGIPLRPDVPLLLLAALPDEPEGEENMPALEAVLREKLDYMLNCQLSISGPHFWLWLLQPLPGHSVESAAATVRGLGERIQQASEASLGLSVSLVFDQKPVVWEQAHERFLQMKYIIEYRLGHHPRMMFAECGFFFRTDPAASGEETQSYIRIQDQIPLLEKAMERGDYDDYFKWAENLLEPVRNTPSAFRLERARVYAALYSAFLDFAARHGLQEHVLSDPRAMAFFDLLSSGGEDLAAYTGSRLIEYLPREDTGRDDAFVGEIDSYIEQNISGDLSLLALADKVYLNPSYLSRRYKELTGKNISETILEVRMSKALQLLGESRIKINEIAAQVGFESPAHFSRVFKKQIGKTPQEYRQGTSS